VRAIIIDGRPTRGARLLEQPSYADTGGSASPQHEQHRDHGRDLLKNLAAGGASSLLKAALQLAMLPLMGRLLGPKEFGLYAMALPVVTFFTVVADGGLGASLAKERSHDTTVWNTAFYVMLALGVCVAGIVNLCGFGLAAVLHEPRLHALLALLSFNFIFIAVSTLPSARLFQRNDLVSLSAVDTIATILGAGLAIGFALHGFGAMSLAVQSAATFGGRALGLNALAFELPGRKTSLKLLASHLHTGGVLVGTRLIDMFCRFAENLLFSLAFGPAALGSYTFANQACRFLVESASNPVWAATYAQSLKLVGAPFVALQCNMARLMMLTVFPAACLVAAASPEVIPFLLGEKWHHAGHFVQILVCSYALAAAATIGGAALLATSHNRLFLFTSTLLVVGRVVAVAIGHWTGPLEATTGVALAQVAYAVVMGVVLSRTYAITPAQILAAIGTPAVAGLAGGLVCFVALYLTPDSHAATIASVALGGLAFLGTLSAIDKDFTIAGLKRSIGKVRAREAEA
jgi:O-antigen/teichoic acid export membrane protein